MVDRLNDILMASHPGTQVFVGSHEEIRVCSLPGAERRMCMFDRLLYNFAETLEHVWREGGTYVWAHAFWERDFYAPGNDADDPVLAHCRRDGIHIRPCPKR